MQRSVDAHGVTLPVLITVAYARGILTGALLADDDAVRETADAVRIAEERGDDVALERGAPCSRAGVEPPPHGC